MAAPRRTALLLLLPLLVAGLSGCTVYNDLQRFLDRARGTPELAPRTLLDEQVAFAPTDTAGSPPQAGKAVRFNFTVPEGARDLSVDITVVFATPAPAPLPVEPPEGVPRGAVNVTVLPPTGPSRFFAFSEDGARVFGDEGPRAGAWAVLVEAVGRGRVELVGTAIAPRL
jgi:hypothetical protein